MGVGFRLGIAAVVIAAVAIPLITVGNTVSSINFPAPTPVITGSTPNAPSPAAPTRHPAARSISYLTEAGVRAGLARVAKLAPGARLDQVRLAATSLIALARLPSGAFKEVALESTGGPFVTSGASTGERFVTLSQIRPRAVARIVAGMKSRFHVPMARIDYMVLSSPPIGPTQWIVFAKGPRHPGFTATLAGARLTRIPGE